MCVSLQRPEAPNEVGVKSIVWSTKQTKLPKDIPQKEAVERKR